MGASLMGAASGPPPTLLSFCQRGAHDTNIGRGQTRARLRHRHVATSTHRTTGRTYMRKNLLLAAAASVLLLQSAPAGAQTRTTLDIYVVDVEGGNATLFVTPSGESLLIDTGNTGPQASVRDASDRKSTRLNSSHLGISYAVFC